MFDPIDLEAIEDARLDRLSWLPCDYCDGTGLVVDNATEESVDCPRCDGLAVLSYIEDIDDGEPDWGRDDDQEG